MKIPLIIASGQGVIPFLFLGVPAAVIGLVCLGVSFFLTLKKRTEDNRAARTLRIVGIVLVAFLFISPALDPAVAWLLNRLMPRP